MSEQPKRFQIPRDIEAEMTPAVKEFVNSLIDYYERQLQDLRKQIEKVNPRNSSLPPSTEHPHAKPKPKPKSSGQKKKRKQGGQKGHPRHLRELIPSEECNSVTPLIPKECRRCGGELEPSSDPPIRHQVWDLPPIEPIVDEYQRHRGFCPCCGITTCGELPKGIPSGQCGPRLAGFVGLLMGHFRQSKRRTSMFLEDLLNIPCSTGWVVKIQNLASDALAAPYEELRNELNEQNQLFVDESPTKEKNNKAWLWVAVAAQFTVFGVFLNRKRESLEKLIPNYRGVILNCDRAKPRPDV